MGYRTTYGLPIVGGYAISYIGCTVVRVLALAALPAPVATGSYMCNWLATHVATVQSLGRMGSRGLRLNSRATKPRQVLVCAHVRGNRLGYMPCVLSCTD